jgi:hypothetical protein
MIGHILPWIQLVSRVEPHNPKNILTAVLIQTCTPLAVALQQNNLGPCKLTIFIDDTFPFNFVSHSVIYLFKLTAKHHLCFHGSDNNKLNMVDAHLQICQSDHKLNCKHTGGMIERIPFRSSVMFTFITEHCNIMNARARVGRSPHYSFTCRVLSLLQVDEENLFLIPRQEWNSKRPCKCDFQSPLVDNVVSPIF